MLDGHNPTYEISLLLALSSRQSGPERYSNYPEPMNVLLCGKRILQMSLEFWIYNRDCWRALKLNIHAGLWRGLDMVELRMRRHLRGQDRPQLRPSGDFLDSFP